MPEIGEHVRWTSSVGVPFAGYVRYIPAWSPTTLHITCDPKRCRCDTQDWHVVSVDRLEVHTPTLF